MQTTLIVVVSIIILVLNAGVLYFVMRKKEEPVKTDDGAMNLLLQQMHNLTQTVDKNLQETNRSMTDSTKTQYSESKQLIDKFQREMSTMIEKVTRVEETGKQMVGFADQLQGLQDMLKNPKQRGVLGEYYLETLLKNVMTPRDYQMQYAFKDGEIVDAIVRIKDKIIPVDSKFSLENYNRMIGEKNDSEKDRFKKLFVNDLKLRIKETSKYIRPSEGTMDFAFMFIPHEAIYYDLLVNTVGALGEDSENLIQRAVKEYKVIIVSPTSFLAYLQTVMQGLKAMEIEEKAKDIVQRVGELGIHLKKYEDYHNKLGNNLATVVNQYVFSSKELKKVDKDVLRITGTAVGLEPVMVDKPELDE
jgi:DNA recombination protein RmuC